MSTLQQTFAKSAYGHVNDVLKKDEPYRKKYATIVHKLPILVRRAGLTQSLAFVHARREESGNDLLDHIAQTIQMDNGKTLLDECLDADIERYIFLTNRVLSTLVWYKRFVESILKISQKEAQNDD